MAKVLIVGAGLAGSVYARVLAEAGHLVHVIDKRPHIGGNCYDYVHPTGVRIHAYGPHLFHTSNQRVVDWLSRFTDWIPYEHSVSALLPDGRLAPMPVNLDTLNIVFNKSLETAEEANAFLDGVSVKRKAIKTAEDHLYATIGRELTELFYRPYTKKMWAMDLADIDANVVRRLKIRPTRDARYFPDDTFQAVPEGGYTSMFERILNHEMIRVSVSTPFKHDALVMYEFCFNSMPIDEFFHFKCGELPYRSIRFNLDIVPLNRAPSAVVINYTHSQPQTRETWWHNIPGHAKGTMVEVVRTIETPCDFRDNNQERYYPVKTHDDRYGDVYKQYYALSHSVRNVQFIGRCGTYQYLDMHQVVNQCLIGASTWLRNLG